MEEAAFTYLRNCPYI